MPAQPLTAVTRRCATLCAVPEWPWSSCASHHLGRSLRQGMSTCNVSCCCLIRLTGYRLHPAREVSHAHMLYIAACIGSGGMGSRQAGCVQAPARRPQPGPSPVHLPHIPPPPSHAGNQPQRPAAFGEQHLPCCWHALGMLSHPDECIHTERIQAACHYVLHLASSDSGLQAAAKNYRSCRQLFIM